MLKRNSSVRFIIYYHLDLFRFHTSKKTDKPHSNFRWNISGSCRTSERKCNNDRCIAHDIVCNGHNPCGDRSDCPTGLEHLSSWAMSGIVVLGLLAGGIIIIMATVCIQRAGGKRYDYVSILSQLLVQSSRLYEILVQISKESRRRDTYNILCIPPHYK